MPSALDTAGGRVSTDAKSILTAIPDAALSATSLRIIARTPAGERPLTATALATFPLATDRSGTTEQLLLVVKPPMKDK